MTEPILGKHGTKSYDRYEHLSYFILLCHRQF